ncbi:MAG: hypothetical protein LBD14_04470 [Puniceicoccales bacterium]|nr:hypothetical protein [Puniceicoccales bacterium]
MNAASQKALDKVFAAAGGKNFKGAELVAFVRSLKPRLNFFNAFANHPQNPENLRFFHWIHKGSGLKPAEAEALTKKVMDTFYAKLRSLGCYTGDPKGIRLRIAEALKGVQDCANNPLNRTVTHHKDDLGRMVAYERYGGNPELNPARQAKRAESFLGGLAGTATPIRGRFLSISAPTGKLDPKILTEQTLSNCSTIAAINTITLNAKANKLAAKKMRRVDNGLEIILDGKRYHVTDQDIRNIRHFAGGDGTGRAIEIACWYEGIERGLFDGFSGPAGLDAGTVIENLLGKKLQRISLDELRLLNEADYITYVATNDISSLGINPRAYTIPILPRHAYTMRQIGDKHVYLSGVGAPKKIQKFTDEEFRKIFPRISFCYV